MAAVRDLSRGPHRPQTNYFVVAAALISLALLVAFAPVKLRASGDESDRSERLGGKLMCMCGCGQVLNECNHVDCPLRAGMFKEIDADVARGESDDLILQDFVQEYGEAVLSSPPAKGFNLVVWIIPGAALALGMCIAILVVRNWRRRAPAVSAPAGSALKGVDAVQFESARRQADRETED
jgi:cytochrome c-type biogenesis protein CcmH